MRMTAALDAKWLKGKRIATWMLDFLEGVGHIDSDPRPCLTAGGPPRPPASLGLASCPAAPFCRDRRVALSIEKPSPLHMEGADAAPLFVVGMLCFNFLFLQNACYFVFQRLAGHPPAVTIGMPSGSDGRST
jgi:hypothetical protein